MIEDCPMLALVGSFELRQIITKHMHSDKLHIISMELTDFLSQVKLKDFRRKVDPAGVAILFNNTYFSDHPTQWPPFLKDIKSLKTIAHRRNIKMWLIVVQEIQMDEDGKERIKELRKCTKVKSEYVIPLTLKFQSCLDRLTSIILEDLLADNFTNEAQKVKTLAIVNPATFSLKAKWFVVVAALSFLIPSLLIQRTKYPLLLERSKGRDDDVLAVVCGKLLLQKSSDLVCFGFGFHAIVVIIMASSFLFVSLFHGWRNSLKKSEYCDACAARKEESDYKKQFEKYKEKYEEQRKRIQESQDNRCKFVWQRKSIGAGAFSYAL